MTQPTFTAVITNYNYRDFVGEAIDSALAQTCRPACVVVVDDGSTDGSAALIRERYANQPCIKVIEQENRGQLAAFVAGTAVQESDVVAFLDADDRWDDGYLESLAAVYAASPAIDYVYTNLRYVGLRKGLYHGSRRSRDEGLSVLSGAFERRWTSSPTSAISVRRALLRRIFELPEPLVQQWRNRADDCLTYGADILGGYKYYLGEALVQYRVHGQNAWLGREASVVVELREWLRAEALASHYRGLAGIDCALRGHYCRKAKQEFLSKSEPPLSDLKRYLRLLEAASLPWHRRLGDRWQMWRHYWTTRAR